MIGNFIVSINFLNNLSNAISKSNSLNSFIFYKNSNDTIPQNNIDQFIRKILEK